MQPFRVACGFVRPRPPRVSHDRHERARTHETSALQQGTADQGADRRPNDGAGTTIAVIEGWDDPSITAVVRQFDMSLGLPNPSITTIYPAGRLPGTCPAGMVKLGSYGSCAAWRGELELDVLSAHLIAPYASIVISATPADTQVQDDAASQVAPPEMMEARSRPRIPVS
jgi:subtilase family serine protease